MTEQQQEILTYLITHGATSETQIKADTGITRIASAIKALRKHGYNIISEEYGVIGLNGAYKAETEYRLEEQDD